MKDDSVHYLLKDAIEHHRKCDAKWWYEWADGSRVEWDQTVGVWSSYVKQGKYLVDWFSTQHDAASALAKLGQGPASVKTSQKEEGQPHAGRRLFKKGDKVRRSQEAFGDHSFVAKVTRDELDDGKCWFADEGGHEAWNPHYLMVLVEAVESAPPAKRRLFNKGDCIYLRGYPHELYWCITDEDSDRWEVDVSKVKDGDHCCSFSTRNHNSPGDMVLVDPSPSCGSPYFGTGVSQVVFPPVPKCEHSGNKYRKTIKSYDKKQSITVDVYGVGDAFEVESKPVFHAIKKLLMAGKRGGKSYEHDLREAVDAIKCELGEC